MTVRAERSAARPAFTSIAPHLYVTDVASSCAFFTAKLGFRMDFTYGEPPFYAQVSRDAAQLALRLVRDAVFRGDIREREELLAASITVATTAEIQALFETYRDAGVRFHHVLKTEIWGARTFVVADLDGNLILFAGPAG